MADQMQQSSAFYEPGDVLNLPVVRERVLEIREVQHPMSVLLSGKPGDAPLPATNRTRSPRPDCMVYGLAPNQWLAVYSAEGGGLTEFASSTLFATDHSDAWACLHVSGDNAPEVLGCLCPVDVHPSVFGHGACFQSRLGGSPVLVSHAPDGFHIFVPRSSARVVLEQLCDTGELTNRTI